MIRRLINSQVWLSQTFDRLLPKKYRIDGNTDFIDSFVPKFLGEELTIYDIGGGKNPYLSVATKQALRARVVGLDIDGDELRLAPEGTYDRMVSVDITQYRGQADADVVICQALLEHVKDNDKAFDSIAGILKSGGLALLFVPSRNAVFARLNLWIPHKLKQSILYSVFPHTMRNQGFPAYYDKCSPKDFSTFARKHGFIIVDERHYYISSYFSFFFPAYLIWRIWILGFHLIRGKQAAETFSMALRKS